MKNILDERVEREPFFKGEYYWNAEMKFVCHIIPLRDNGPEDEVMAVLYTSKGEMSTVSVVATKGTEEV